MLTNQEQLRRLTLPGTARSITPTPFQFYTDPADRLLVRVWSSIATTISLEGRFLNEEQKIDTFRRTFNTAADGLPEVFEMNLPVGFILNCSVSIVGSAAVHRGRCFVQVRVIRGSGTARVELGTLVQGYIGTGNYLAWPGSPIQSSYDGPGYVRELVSADSAIGADGGAVSPTRARWRVLSAQFTFSTSAAVGNRYVLLTLKTAIGTTAWRLASGATQTASNSWFYSWLAGLGINITTPGSAITQSLPVDLFVQPGWIVGATADGLNANDDFTAFRYIVEEWIDIDDIGGIGEL